MAADIPRLLDYCVRSLVDDPDSVAIERVDTPSGQLYQVTVAPDDAGKVIGRGGRIIKALRILARAAGSTDGTHVDVELQD